MSTFPALSLDETDNLNDIDGRASVRFEPRRLFSHVGR
jgi:hypothetical protein